MKALGYAASFTYFGALALLMLGAALGECFPASAQVCPTEHDRLINLAEIFVVGIALYTGLMCIFRFLTNTD